MPDWFGVLVSRSYRVRWGQQKVPDKHQLILESILVSPDEKLIYVKNAKAGSTTITRAFYHYANGKPFPSPKGIHRPVAKLRQGVQYWHENYQTLMSGNGFLFTTVRHPYRRTVSAFKNFFVEQRNDQTHLHLSAIRQFGYSEANSLTRNFDVFLDYIEASFSLDQFHTDPHWRKQIYNTGLPHLRFDHIARLENLDEEMPRIAELAGIKDPYGAFRVSEHANRSEPVDFWPDAAQRARVRTLYEDDFQAFGYDDVTS